MLLAATIGFAESVCDLQKKGNGEQATATGTVANLTQTQGATTFDLRGDGCSFGVVFTQAGLGLRNGKPATVTGTVRMTNLGDGRTVAHIWGEAVK
jgi:hypothetical protein